MHSDIQTDLQKMENLGIKIFMGIKWAVYHLKIEEIASIIKCRQ